MRRFAKTRPPFTFQNPHRRLARPNQGSEESETEVETETSIPEFELPEAPKVSKILPGLKRNDSELIIREFDSFYDFITCASDSSLRAWRNCFSQKIQINSNWSGTKTFDEAIDLAMNGWPEGRNLMSESLAIAQPQNKIAKLEIYDVAGAFPLVPLYCAGDPASMVDFHADHLTSHPIVTICTNISAPASVQVSQFMIRGAAILSFAHDLESRGYSVELRIAHKSDAIRSGPSILTTFIFKSAGENLDLDRAAFVLAHPSIIRRLSFAIKEQHIELERSMGSSYGRAGEIEETDPTTIYIPPDYSNDPEKSRKMVETAAAKFLNSIKSSESSESSFRELEPAL